MKSENKTWFARGLRAGVPIGLGYFAVAFTLGLAARSAGLTACLAPLSSLLLHAAAGEVVANARYLLMSFSLSQKLRPETGLIHRLILGWYVTDEVFGVSISAPGYLNPWYTYGAIALACPGWAAGTCLGVILGNIFPASVVSALSVGLYGMFIAIFVPPARESRTIRGLVLVSMGLSFFVNRASMFAGVSSGIKTILLTVILSAAAAILFPIREAKNDAA